MFDSDVKIFLDTDGAASSRVGNILPLRVEGSIPYRAPLAVIMDRTCSSGPRAGVVSCPRHTACVPCTCGAVNTFGDTTVDDRDVVSCVLVVPCHCIPGGPFTLPHHPLNCVIACLRVVVASWWPTSACGPATSRRLLN